ncbi:MAG TPA: hypothetical protein VFS00_06740, partial [Polyangiaceae bacterium]|nr:hypothetical protein [Polyangiaceae bacterium]
AAYHRAGRSADANEALDEARRRAVALRGARYGVSARTAALGDLARSELVLGRRERALETARKLGRGLPRDTLAQDLAVAAAEHADLSAAREAIGLMHDPALAALAVARVGRATLAREGVELGLGPPALSTRW